MITRMLASGLLITFLGCSAIAQDAAPGPAPRKAQFNTDRWGKEVGETLKLARASIEMGDRTELRKQGYRASRLVGEAGGWPDHPAWRVARLQCVRTAQALMNMIGDIEKGTARGLVSAEEELKVMMTVSGECASRLEKLR
jgi:hypothetical protein